MGGKMPRSWEIETNWENLENGGNEERACFAALGIRAHHHWLTEGRDALANRLRQAPYLSAYHLAEWLAWNWWRLRWEPRARSAEWAYAHKMANIGGGYIWPDITVLSDGERTALTSKATQERPETPFRYINNTTAIIPSLEFEEGIDSFLEQVLERLDAMSLKDSNLSRIWADVRNERNTPAQAARRKLEALLGYDPDEAAPLVLDRLLADADQLGKAATEELAAGTGWIGGRQAPPAAEDIQHEAQRHGFDLSPGDTVQPLKIVRHKPQTPAWQFGEAVAKTLREQEHLGDESRIDDARLAALIGADPALLDSHETTEMGISFVLQQADRRSRISLRNHHHPNRRFALARLLADRLYSASGDSLFIATNAGTYRQKMQRAFAAELLSPYTAVENMLAGDYSPENQQAVAEHFEVSEMTIRTQLVNHHVLDREQLDTDDFVLAA